MDLDPCGRVQCRGAQTTSGGPPARQFSMYIRGQVGIRARWVLASAASRSKLYIAGRGGSVSTVLGAPTRQLLKMLERCWWSIPISQTLALIPRRVAVVRSLFHSSIPEALLQ
jgi:hypothetical protein